MALHIVQSLQSPAYSAVPVQHLGIVHGLQRPTYSAGSIQPCI